MLYAEADFWLGHDEEQFARESREAIRARDIQLAREANRTPSFRQRAGEAVIAFGVRFAGDRRTVSEVRRVAARAS